MSFSRFSLVCFMFCSIAPAHAEDSSLKAQTPHITIAGSAHAEVVPDLAIVSLTVVTERPTATAAANDNATAATSVVNDIKAQGIEAKDIRTVSVTLSPLYDESRDLNGRLIKRTFRAYQARDEFEVRIRALDKAGNFARQWIEKGANNFGGISFEIEHPEERLKVLEAEAAKDALARAKNYADAVGVKLGRVIEIAPESDSRSRYMPAPMMAKAVAGSADSTQASIPIEPGVRSLSASITVTWELVQ
jgi:uncharacterized protein YggE